MILQYSIAVNSVSPRIFNFVIERGQQRVGVTKYPRARKCSTLRCSLVDLLKTKSRNRNYCTRRRTNKAEHNITIINDYDKPIPYCRSNRIH